MSLDRDLAYLDTFFDEIMDRLDEVAELVFEELGTKDLINLLEQEKNIEILAFYDPEENIVVKTNEPVHERWQFEPRRLK